MWFLCKFLMFLGLIFSLKRTQVGIPFEVEFRKIELVMKKQMNLGSCPSLLPLEIGLFSFAGKIQVRDSGWLVIDPALYKQSKESILVGKKKGERQQPKWRSWNLFIQLTHHLLLLRTQAVIRWQSSVIVKDGRKWHSCGGGGSHWKETRGIIGHRGRFI